MKKARRITAFILSLVMLLSTQGMMTLAETEGRIMENLPLEMIEEGEEKPERISGTRTLEPVEEPDRVSEAVELEPMEEPEKVSETLPLETIEPTEPSEAEEQQSPSTFQRGGAIYWNPGGILPAEILASASNATASNALKEDSTYLFDSESLATDSNAAEGDDRADGLSPERPVRSLETALIRADELAEELGIDKSEITIYAMNPMEIEDGHMYVLNAGGIRIASWDGRAYLNDTVFYLNGGQLALVNTSLESGRDEADVEESELIRVDGGALQLGLGVQLDGLIVMDYLRSKEQRDWETATDSDAEETATASAWTESGESGAGFDINDYIFTTEEGEWELLEDTSKESTWRAPIIELLEGFEGVEGGLLLEIRGDEDLNTVTLAETLYANELSDEEFESFFRIKDVSGGQWELWATSGETATVRDTGLSDLERYYEETGRPRKARNSSMFFFVEEDGASAGAIAPMTVKRLSATRAASGNVIYWNPGGPFSNGTTTYPSGNDGDHDGTIPGAPVKSFENAVELANGGTIIVMQTLDLDSVDAWDYLVKKPNLVQDKTAPYKVGTEFKETAPTLKMWEVTSAPFFILPAGKSLILENIYLEGPTDSSGNVAEAGAVIVDNGDLTVGAGVTAQTGYIQVEAKSTLKDHPIKAASTDGVQVKLFFSGINNNLSHRYTDVIEPTDVLFPDGANASAEEKQRISSALLDCYGLVKAHSKNDGSSQFEWVLRPDTAEDDGNDFSHKLELYTDYNYDAVYLNGVSGDDNNLGATCEYPVKTWEKAKEIWGQQMAISIQERRNAMVQNPALTREELDKSYPYPGKIYICDTVTVADTQTWELDPVSDYDGTTELVTEVSPHVIVKAADNTTPKNHEEPQAMVEVTGNGSLTLNNLVIRNHSDVADTASVRVVSGGALTLTGSTLMTGERREAHYKDGDKTIDVEAKTVTRGAQIKAESGGSVVLDTNWIGSIQNSQQGIVADGAGTTVTMNGGSIQRNDAYDKEASAQKKGGGVALSGGAGFIMNGGTISENKAWDYGSGVYLTGEGTSFVLNEGSVSRNTVSGGGTYGTSSHDFYGVGMFGDTGTIITVGQNVEPADPAAPAKAVIKENKSYGGARGVGICSYGTVNVYYAEIINNMADNSFKNTTNNVIDSALVVRGVGIGMIGKSAELTVEGSKISGNRVQREEGSSKNEAANGVGIFLSSAGLTKINNSEISDNSGGAGSAGGGIYADGSSVLQLTNSKILRNRASNSAGISASGGAAIERCTIEENKATSSPTVSEEPVVNPSAVGGVNLGNTGGVITDGSISNNGGMGVSAGGGAFFDQSTLTIQGSQEDGVKIQGNAGRGIYVSYMPSRIKNTLVSENKGGGVDLAYNTHMLKNVKILNNQVTGGGGGLAVGTSSFDVLVPTAYLTDVKIEGNTANNAENSSNGNGGGVWFRGAIYWTETTPGASSLKGNHAGNFGGGIYRRPFTRDSVLDFSTDSQIQNSAGKQGSNLYVAGGGLYLTGGKFLQPEAQKQVEGVYNVYLDVSSGRGMHLDPQKVTIEKKAEPGEAEAVFLGTASSVLYYLKAPVNNNPTLWVDLNDRAFSVGSVVISPANKGTLRFSEVKEKKNDDGSIAPLADLVLESKTLSYSDGLKDASINQEYASVGKLPRRTQIGAFEDAGLTNVILVGEGVYLSGAGEDTNSGKSPKAAVKTFARAKEILEKEIRAKAADEENLPQGEEKQGFSPYIYICGQVTVADESWELYARPDPDDPGQPKYELYTETNAAFAEAERSYWGDQVDEDNLQPQVRRFASFVKKPMVVVEQNSTFELNRCIIDGMVDAVILADQGNSSPVIQGLSKSSVTIGQDAQVRNNYGYGIEFPTPLTNQGNLGTLRLTGNAQVKDIEGNAVSFYGTTMTMEGNSRILSTRRKTQNAANTVRNGVQVGGVGAKVVMKGNSRIETIIDEDDAGSPRFDRGIDFVSYTVPSGSAYDNQLEMQDFAEIKNCTYGVVKQHDNIKVLMNWNTDAGENDSAKIQNDNAGSGIHMNSSAKSGEIRMGKKAIISSGKTGGTGISYNGSGTSAANAKFVLEMGGDSTIRGFSNGIAMSGVPTPIEITMDGNARIIRNLYGIHELNSSVKKVSLTMKGYSRIGANQNEGYCARGYAGNENRQLIMEYFAVIGAAIVKEEAPDGKEKEVTPDYTNNPDSKYYETCGNGGYGIWAANVPFDIVMDGDSAIRNNKKTGFFSQRTNGSTYSPNTGTIVMRGRSRIEKNGAGGTNGSRFVQGDGIHLSQSNNTAYPNPWEITLEGDAAVRDNNYTENGTPWPEISLSKSSELHLKGNATVAETEPSGERNAIYAEGKVFVESPSINIRGRIHLADAGNPLTLAAALPKEKRFHLHLAEGFLGKPVVVPDSSQGATVPDATPYWRNFVKDLADGLAAEKNIIALEPNLVLQGENNVYLSGAGNDNNDGNSPSTAVRTFHRARELLETGYFTSGANVIISGQVTIGDWTDDSGTAHPDNDWSFDQGGTVTNAQSHQTWTPMVQRYSKYKSGRMISISTNKKAVFRNITIDGNGENVAVNNNVSEMIEIGAGGSCVLGGGAIVQNGKSMNSPQLAAVGIIVLGGTLEIDGGIIRGMKAEWRTGSSRVPVHFASALYCRGANVLFKSGQICDNEIIHLYSNYGVFASAALFTGGSKLSMSGGTISGNTTAPTSKNPSALGFGGALSLLNSYATITGGNIQNNTGGKGSAIYYESSLTGDTGAVTLSGGVIKDNQADTTIAGVGLYGQWSPVYVNGRNFELKGGGCDVRDAFYLTDTRAPIILSGEIYQKGRLYKLCLNQGTGANQYHKGSEVVVPDGIHKLQTAQNLPSFVVMSNYGLYKGEAETPIAYNPQIKENQCLILKKEVFINGEGGSDGNTGLTPQQAVQTFTRAKQVGEASDGGDKDYYVIYVCGKVTNTAAETVWSLPSTASMCRYTGFDVYDANGNPTTMGNLPYHGTLIEPQRNLEMREISIYGRREIDSESLNGESLLSIPDGVTVTFTAENGGEPILARNHNIGSYTDPDYNQQISLSSRGGAVYIASGGTLNMSAGKILDTTAAYGAAVYLAADETDPLKIGHLVLDGAPSVSGKVYLAGNGYTTAAYVEPKETYTPAVPLQISIQNDHNKRMCVKYPDTYTPGVTQMEYYAFDDSVKAMYSIIYRETQRNVIELQQRGAIYLDGENGNDANDGSTPEQAFKTLKKVYESIQAKQNANPLEDNGNVVFVVGTVELSNDAGSPNKITIQNLQRVNAETGLLHYEGYYEDTGTPQIPVKGQVYFKRYAQPKGYNSADPIYDGYNKATLLKELFQVNSGHTLELMGVYLDGHSNETDSSNPLYEADGVQAEAPLVTVNEGGILIGGYKDSTGDSVSTFTLFSNNVNVRSKTTSVGTLNGSNILEGSSAGIDLQPGGTCQLNHVEFRGLSLGENVTGGTDIYHYGQELRFENLMLFEGSVFLEGIGTLNGGQDTSRYMKAAKYGRPVIRSFEVVIRDPYNGRKVIEYPERLPGEPGAGAEAERYHLNESTKEHFYLAERSGAINILELKVPQAVYIDGINGSDTNTGLTPSEPIKSLWHAYELLKTYSGNTIYVVNTVQIDGSVSVHGSAYKGPGDKAVALTSTNKVNLVRYIQPDFARGLLPIGASAYDVEDFKGPLVQVAANGTLSAGSGFMIDGHSQEWIHADYPREVIVSRTTESAGPLVQVDDGGVAEFMEGSALQYNNNTFDSSAGAAGMEGGAFYNKGEVKIEGASFTENHALKGDAVYQAGTFTIEWGVNELEGHSFWLAATDNGGVWTDHVLQLAEAVPVNQRLNIDMDHAEAGRDVLRFTDAGAYAPADGADAEHEHVVLGTTVPEHLFLVEAEDDASILELQNWRVLKVEVPKDVYLAVRRIGDVDSATRLMGITGNGTDLLSSPEYEIKNTGNYDAKVSIVGMDNVSAAAGITQYGDIELKGRAEDALTENELYLGIKGMDTDAANGLTFGEQALTTNMSGFELGRLTAGSSGRVMFTGKAGQGFVDKYKDGDFPVSGTAEEAIEYMDGSASGMVNARAKYLLKYKVEIEPGRRN